MSNQSFTSGNLSILAKDYDTAREVAKLLNSVTSYFSFYTALNLEDKVYQIDEENRFECRFDAKGRWNYLNNIRYLGEWLDEYRNQSFKHEKNVSKLEYLGFELTFDYIDIRESDGSIDRAVVKVTHVADTPIHSMAYKKVRYARHQYSEKNLDKVTGSDVLFA